MSDERAATHRLLLVDDEVNFLWPVARALRVKGYDVVTAESGEAALVELGRGRFDLVITDIKMPGMDGFELVEWLRANRPDVSVVMTTAFGSLTMRERSLELGALSYIEKPIDLPMLTGFLDRLFHAPGFAGRISDIDLLDYLQLIATTHKTKIVQVTNRRETGRLVMEAGQIIHAECGELSGQTAFHRIVSWGGGAFTDIPFEPPPVKTMEENTAYLLMEAARIRDERAQREESSTAQIGGTRPEGAGPTAKAAPVAGGSEEKSGGGPFGRFRRFLDGLNALAGVQGAVLLSREGLILARGGAFPGGIEPLILSFSEAFDEVGALLDLGRHDSGALKLASGELIHMLPVGPYLLGVWMTAERQSAEVSSWVRERAGTLD